MDPGYSVTVADGCTHMLQRERKYGRCNNKDNNRRNRVHEAPHFITETLLDNCTRL